MEQQIKFCKYCKHSVTLADQKNACGRLLRSDYSPEVAKSILPAHAKCALKHAKDAKIDKIKKSDVD